MGKMLDKLNEFLGTASQEELDEMYNNLSHLIPHSNETYGLPTYENIEEKCRVENPTRLELALWVRDIAVNRIKEIKTNVLNAHCELCNRFCKSEDTTCDTSKCVERDFISKAIEN